MDQFIKTLDEYYVISKYGRDHSHCLFGSTPATAANWGPYFTASHPMEIVLVLFSWTANSSSGTAMLEKLTPGTAIGSGDNILSATVSTASGANTPVTLSKNDLTSARVLKAGDRIGLEDGGTLTGLTDFVATIYYVPTGRGSYMP